MAEGRGNFCVVTGAAKFNKLQWFTQEKKAFLRKPEAETFDSF